MFYLYQLIIACGSLPFQWRGGTISSSYKGKCAPQECDNSRGFLISDHSGKAFIGLLQEEINPFYRQYVSANQFGSIPARGIALASHTLGSFIDFCAAKSCSCFVPFVDLSKAFDRIVREFVMGEMHNPASSLVTLLQRIGFSDEETQTI